MEEYNVSKCFRFNEGDYAFFDSKGKTILPPSFCKIMELYTFKGEDVANVIFLGSLSKIVSVARVELRDLKTAEELAES